MHTPICEQKSQFWWGRAWCTVFYTKVSMRLNLVTVISTEVTYSCRNVTSQKLAIWDIYAADDTQTQMCELGLSGSPLFRCNSLREITFRVKLFMDTSFLDTNVSSTLVTGIACCRDILSCVYHRVRFQPPPSPIHASSRRDSGGKIENKWFLAWPTCTRRFKATVWCSLLQKQKTTYLSCGLNDQLTKRSFNETWRFDQTICRWNDVRWTDRYRLVVYWKLIV